ncbi:hypothetical protein PI124_g8169 [Phytophthora idaei]|nr:hypothetical protein PI125_g8230 [Phytophthora idaei]KAG3159670.1 hypothetical protein PI126_g7271 [Phytophthora idaei]KAG3247134.1 hypothetical protein PI124_g8169 [Phytophthora idaei]
MVLHARPSNKAEWSSMLTASSLSSTALVALAMSSLCAMIAFALLFER